MATPTPPAAPAGAPHAAIIGASVSGLAAALALGLRGYRITCIERDATPMPRDHLDAFEKWDRRGAAQTRHSHVLAAREHVDVLRALFRHTNLLDLPQALFARQDLLGKVFACYEKSRDEDTKLRPLRDEMLALFAAAV